MERVATLREVYIKCGALSLAQRALLYAKDELEMCVMRMQVKFLIVWPYSPAVYVMRELDSVLMPVWRYPLVL